jgi:hypothetical protein
MQPEIVTGTVKFFVNGPAAQIRANLPHGVLGVPYAYSLSAVGGTRPFHWQVTGLPPGLTADASGNITGTPTVVGNYTFGVQMTDSSQPSPIFVGTAGTIRVKAFTGRHDSVATATDLHGGVYLASLSPYANAAGVAESDQDYYRVTVAAGSILDLMVQPNGSNLIDPVAELVDASSVRMSNCKVPGSTTFTSACLNDDIDPGLNHTASLAWQNNSASDQVVYIHVFDWSGNARPDLKYRMSIGGAN